MRIYILSQVPLTFFPGSFRIRQPLATQYHGPHRARDETGPAIVQGPNRLSGLEARRHNSPEKFEI